MKSKLQHRCITTEIKKGKSKHHQIEMSEELLHARIEKLDKIFQSQTFSDPYESKRSEQKPNYFGKFAQGLGDNINRIIRKDDHSSDSFSSNNSRSSSWDKGKQEDKDFPKIFLEGFSENVEKIMKKFHPHDNKANKIEHSNTSDNQRREPRPNPLHLPFFQNFANIEDNKKFNLNLGKNDTENISKSQERGIPPHQCVLDILTTNISKINLPKMGKQSHSSPEIEQMKNQKEENREPAYEAEEYTSIPVEIETNTSQTLTNDLDNGELIIICVEHFNKERKHLRRSSSMPLLKSNNSNDNSNYNSIFQGSGHKNSKRPSFERCLSQPCFLFNQAA